MYYVIMYGSIILAVIAILIDGIIKVITPADKLKLKLKPGQDRESMVIQTRKQGRLYIIASVAVGLMIVIGVIGSWPYIPGINH